MDRMQPSAFDPMVDRLRRVADGHEVRMRHHALLPIRKAPDHFVGELMTP